MATDQSSRVRFEAAFRAHSRSVLGYAMRRTPQPADAADVVAETFTVAWRRVDQLPDGADARLWLFGIARNVLANARRGERRRDRLAARLHEQIATQMPAPAHEPDPQVRRAFAGLGGADREILALSAWEGLDPAQIAQVLGLSPVAARTRLHRARARMRRALQRETADIDGVTTPITVHQTGSAR